MIFVIIILYVTTIIFLTREGHMVRDKSSNV